jgi:5-methylcytosine-specific restriction endonuclease McrBC regulatory subunit McrC
MDDHLWRVGAYVGMVWLGGDEERWVLRVHPKQVFKDMDYLSMYLRAAADPVVSQHLGRCLFFWPDEEPIDIGTQAFDCSILIVSAFLRVLNIFCLRHMRRHFTMEQTNLSGKVRGRVLFSAHVRENTVHHRLDRVYCAYQTLSDDSLANSILRAALEQSARLLRRTSLRQHQEELLWRWVHVAKSTLHSVSLRRIQPRDFLGIHYQGTYSHYREPHRYAKMVLRLLGFDPESEPCEQHAATPPFALNTAELFERYTEVLLREQYPDLEAGYDDRTIYAQNGGYAVRPDFWLPRHGQRWILDAKYKEMPTDCKEPRCDVYQIIAYTRHQNLLKRLFKNQPDVIDAKPDKVFLLYPERKGSGVKEQLRLDNTKLIDAESDHSFTVPLCCAEIPWPSKDEQ